MPNAAITKPIETLKPGVHTDERGTVVEFTEEMLQDIAKVYDPAKHEAPFVVGHPKLDAPAYGWAQRFVVKDGLLFAEGGQVEEQFAGLVNEGRFKKVSMALYGPKAVNNPCPGHWYPKHVGFLGAKPPAIKGLRSVQFAEEDEGVHVFGEYAQSTSLRLLRNLRDWMLEKFGQEAADKVLPSWELQSAAESVVAESVRESITSADGLSPAFAEASSSGAQDDDMPHAQVQQLQQQLAESQRREQEAKDALQARQQADAEVSAAQLQADAVAFAEGLVTEAKQPVERKGALVALYKRVAAPDADGQVLSFGEGDAAFSGVELLADLAGRAEASVQFGEHGQTKGRRVDDLSISDEDTLDQVQFGEGANVDPERLDLHRKALSLQRKRQGAGTPLDYLTAVRLVRSGVMA